MASKPETTFYTAVHRHLPPITELHREKMANPYRGGTFDHWYDGVNDLWIEWKFIVLPKRPDTVIDLVTPRGKRMESPLSALQQQWGRDRFNNGRAAWVIVGCQEGGVVYDQGNWHLPLTAAEFRRRLVDRKTIAGLIKAHVYP